MDFNSKKILIIEDEFENALFIKKVIEEISGDLSVFIADNVDKAYSAAIQNNIDVFVVDIVLDIATPNDASGIKFARDMRNLQQYKFTPIIFLTSLHDPEIYAYRELHCYGYVEKPFDPKEVKKLVTDALEYEAPIQEEKVIFFKKEGVFYPIKPSVIVYLQSTKHKLFIHLSDGTMLTVNYFSCKQIIDEAQSKELLQCSRSTIVNRNFVMSIDYANDVIVMKGNERIEIGLRYKKKFIEAMR